MNEKLHELKIAEYEIRLTKLEKRNRFLTIICALALFAPLLSLVAWKETRYASGDNIAGAVTRLENGEPILRFWDRNLTTRIRMGIVHNEPVLIFYDRYGRVRTRIGLKNDYPDISMYDSQGNPVAVIPTR
ncbi:MAG TPA: hypothetical protein VNK96_05155 [Fimbriimonadales bacterium]|nr:hypothetical protein [Fimbriimonadales bacterium]